MNTCSAIVLISTGIMSAAWTVVSVALLMNMVAAMAAANAASMNLRLVVLIVSFIKLLCDLVVYRTLGQYAEGYAGSNWHTHLFSKGKITFQSFLNVNRRQRRNREAILRRSSFPPVESSLFIGSLQTKS